MSINTKRELLLRIRREYAAANKKRKSALLDSLIEATGYNRKYAIFILSLAPRKEISQRRIRKSKYGSEVIDAVRQLWKAANGICAKRLRPFLPTMIETLERCGHMKLDKSLKKKILQMSVSTLERTLKKERDKESKGKSLTRPGSLLRKQVAVKTFAAWNDQQIGFFEIDLVAHCGGVISGKFLHTLTMTDIATGWTEIVPLLNAASTQVRFGLEQAIDLLPFKLKGIDSDNGKEFLNHEMVAWCKARKITFTRSRAYRKNDQAHVEEKNGSVVRRLVGYERFEGRQALEVMTQLYAVSRLYVNYFQPSMKLVSKTRIGARVTKKYDTARTPLERLLVFKTIPNARKASLKRQFRKLDPVVLLADMANLQSKLWQVMSEKPTAETATTTAKQEEQEKTPTLNKRPLRNSTLDEVTSQDSLPKRVASKKRNRTGPEKGKTNKTNTRVNITSAFVENAVHPPSGQIIYRDSTLIGFGLRVTHGVSKSFVVEARVNGMKHRLTIGRADLFSLEEARYEAARLLYQMARGIEPLRLKNKQKRRLENK